MTSRIAIFGIFIFLTLFTAIKASAEFFFPENYEAAKGIALFEEKGNDGDQNLKPNLNLTEKGNSIIFWVIQELLSVPEGMNIQDRKKYFSDGEAWTAYQRYVARTCDLNKAGCLDPRPTGQSSRYSKPLKISLSPFISSTGDLILTAIGTLEISSPGTNTSTVEMFSLHIAPTISKPYDIEHLKISNWQLSIYTKTWPSP